MSADAPRAAAKATRRLFRARMRAIAQDHAAQLFFAELDAESTPGSAPKHVTAAVDHIDPKLGFRLRSRALHDRNGRLPRFSAFRPDSEDRRTLSLLSRMIKRLAKRHLADREQFDYAFERFVTGRLSTGHPDPEVRRALLLHGVPNGANFFKFGELALCCIDNGVHANFWRKRLATLVRCARLFLSHVGERGEGPHKLGSARYGHVPGRHTDDGELDRLRDSYAPLRGPDAEPALRTLFTIIVGEALRDEKGSVPPGSGTPRHV